MTLSEKIIRLFSYAICFFYLANGLLAFVVLISGFSESPEYSDTIFSIFKVIFAPFIFFGTALFFLNLGPSRFLQFNIYDSDKVFLNQPPILILLGGIAVAGSILGILALRRMRKDRRWLRVWYGLNILSLIVAIDNIFYLQKVYRDDRSWLFAVPSVILFLLITFIVLNFRRRIASQSTPLSR